MQKKLSAIVVAGLLGTVLTGCGGSSSDTQAKKLPEIAPAGIENLEVSQDSLEGLWLTTINVEGQRAVSVYEDIPILGDISLSMQATGLMRITGSSEQGYSYTNCSDEEREPQALRVEGNQVIFPDSESDEPFSATIINNSKIIINTDGMSSSDSEEDPASVQFNFNTASASSYKVRDDVESPIGTLQIADNETINLYCMEASSVNSSLEITGVPQTITTRQNTLELSDINGTSLEADWLVTPEVEGFDISSIIPSRSAVDFNYAGTNYNADITNIEAPASSFLEYSKQGTVTFDGNEIDFTLNIDLK
ncbi:hypothetical protein [Pelagibaculum spongiae]|uniref:Uncharacterized protein n=1 Tax=Pelagibaculum spongiae TaxID=2080658 RepID=A0A2V1GS99_9GAMM|nr:hypothetical protein [Pelagibaculum spongiae]PVZ63916.1 hypothetical protein DC094_20560 [Pelagibaculum spongiae]